MLSLTLDVYYLDIEFISNYESFQLQFDQSFMGIGKNVVDAKYMKIEGLGV